jgi:hypothetical protein
MRPACVSAVLTVLFSAPLIALPAAAEAGGYDVHACETSWAPPANNAFVARADAGMTAYSDCPAGGGMVARNAFDGGSTPSGSGAYLIFDAPPGTSIGSMDFDAGFQRHDCGYSVSLVAGNRDMGGATVWGQRAGDACDSWQSPGATAFFPIRWSVPINALRVRAQSRCANGGSCNRNGVAAIRLRNVVVHMVDNEGPVLSGGRGALWNGAWVSGTQSVGFDSSDGSGIRGLEMRVDSRPVSQKALGCDFTRPAPCPATAAADEPLATAAFGADGEHQLAFTATDAAGNASTVTRTIRVDNSAPDAPVGLSLDGDAGWRKANRFDVRWSNPPPTAAPIVGAEWRMCREGSETACVTGSRSMSGVAALADLKVPSAGAWTLRVWLRDAAGNQDPRLAAPPLTLRYDETSPDVIFSSLSADDPTLLSARTSDEGAGVVGGEFAIRKEGASSWRPLSTTLDGATLTARIDDADLSDGNYELMVQATDGAGNARVSTTFANGQPARITLPLRLKTKLVAGLARRANGRVRLLRSAYAGYGRLVRVRGQLRTPEGNPMQDQEIRAYSQVRDGQTPARLIATVKTSRTGAFSFLIQPGPSRTVRIEYAGAGQIRSASKRLVLYVRSATTLRPSRRLLVNGETVRFSGRVRTGRIPMKGKLIELEVLNRGRWRTFATTRANRRGSWKYDYRFDGTRGLQRYRFRAKIPRETGYPFAAGGSRAIAVKVRGV